MADETKKKEVLEKLKNAVIQYNRKLREEKQRRNRGLKW